MTPQKRRAVLLSQALSLTNDALKLLDEAAATHLAVHLDLVVELLRLELGEPAGNLPMATGD